MAFTVDVRPGNKYTERIYFPMPNLEMELRKLQGTKYSAKFDLSHGYWQLPLQKESQECKSFITPDGILTPTRVLHGTTNAVTHLQSTITELIPNSLNKVTFFWLEDVHNHSPAI